MPQGPLGAYVAKAISNALAPLILDSVSLLMTSRGGTLSKLDVTASAVVKASPGRVARIVVTTVTATAAITVNDTTTTGGAAAANTILSIPTAAAVGTVYDLDWPCANGIVINFGSATGGLAISYT